jgi:glycine cleavage system H protein
MSNVAQDLRYADTHEWVRVNGKTAVVGISDHAQELLGELVYVELPEVGADIAAGDEVCVVESVKAASDVYSPVSGTIVEVNEALEGAPNLVNDAPYSGGWLFKVELSNVSEAEAMMDAAAYEECLD